MVTRITIPDKAMEKHRTLLRAATSPDTHHDSLAAKIPALNRIICGWCRYYQYTSRAQAQFHKQGHEAFWRMAHWLGRKYRLTMPKVLARFYTKSGPTKSLGEGEVRLIQHTSFKTRRYVASPSKPNPYTTQAVIEREELLDDNPWLGTEERPGMADLRPVVLERDEYRCCLCKEPVSNATAQVDHLRPVSHYKRPVDANCLDNLWTLCVACHKRKTEIDRQMESRVP